MNPSDDMIYDSTKHGPAALEELCGIIKYRDLIYQLGLHDMVSCYKHSVMGIGCTLLQPLVRIILYGFSEYRWPQTGGVVHCSL